MEIYRYKKYENILQLEKVVFLIKEQMKVIKSKKSENEIEESLKNALMNDKRSYLIVCYQTDEPIGFIFGNISSGLESGKDYFWINEIHVKKDSRRKKLASGMIKYLEQWLDGKGIQHVLTMTSKKNIASKELFDRLEYDESEVIWIDKYIK